MLGIEPRPHAYKASALPMEPHPPSSPCVLSLRLSLQASYPPATETDLVKNTYDLYIAKPKGQLSVFAILDHIQHNCCSILGTILPFAS